MLPLFLSKKDGCLLKNPDSLPTLCPTQPPRALFVSFQAVREARWHRIMVARRLAAGGSPNVGRGIGVRISDSDSLSGTSSSGPFAPIYGGLKESSGVA